MRELVHYETGGAGGAVATITLDSPDNRNALSRQLVTELLDHLVRAGQDESVRAVLLQATGSVFCSGADLSEASTVPMEEAARGIVEVQRRILALPKPVLTRLQGAVRAGGTGIVAASDIVVAADRASFALTEVKLGLAPAVISLTVLARMTSRAAALTCLGGEVFGAEEAREHGLVTRVVPADDLDAAIDEQLASLVTGAPQGLRETKALLTRELLAAIDEHADAVVAQSARLFGSEEARAAMTAFLSRKR